MHLCRACQQKGWWVLRVAAFSYLIFHRLVHIYDLNAVNIQDVKRNGKAKNQSVPLSVLVKQDLRCVVGGMHLLKFWETEKENWITYNICIFIFYPHISLPQVSWIRKQSLHVLTSNVITFTGDNRFYQLRIFFCICICITFTFLDAITFCTEPVF